MQLIEQPYKFVWETRQHLPSLVGKGLTHLFFTCTGTETTGLSPHAENNQSQPLPEGKVLSVWYMQSANVALQSIDRRPRMPELLRFPGKRETINIPQRISTKYRTFGIFLLDDDIGSVVEALVLQHRDDSMAINMAILRKWMEGVGRQPVTWQTLVEALRDSELNTLADDIYEVKLM